MSENDGIKELDNKLPTGWLVFYLAGIAWLIWYIISFTPQISGWSYNKNFDADHAAMKARAAATQASAGNPFKDNAAAVDEGMKLYASSCAGCHGADLEHPTVGPDLRTPKLKYGETEQDVFASIAKGRANGMPGFEAQLGADRTWKLVSYVMHERSEGHEHGEKPAAKGETEEHGQKEGKGK